MADSSNRREGNKVTVKPSGLDLKGCMSRKMKNIYLRKLKLKKKKNIFTEKNSIFLKIKIMLTKQMMFAKSSGCWFRVSS